jgi:predicted nuclease with TOPRIM domain
MEAERASFQAALEVSESQRQQRHAEERKELEARFDRIEKLAETLGESAGSNQGGLEPIQEVLDELREGRETWRAAQSSSESANADLLRMADDLAATRQDLAEAREELRAQRELLHRASTGSESSPDPEIRERLDRLEQERLDWARQRAALETELDAVRNRAAELSDTLEDERQRASGDRKDWAGEMRQMRQLLQTLSERPAVNAAEAAAPAPAAEQPVEQQDAQDPVLDSVMAQFEILQKDLARRRKAKPAAK